MVKKKKKTKIKVGIGEGHVNGWHGCCIGNMARGRRADD
jgi:hypothetical protein